MMINSAAVAELCVAKPYVYMGHGTVPKNVTGVTVDKSITIIPNRAFQFCKNLKEVILPEGLQEIEGWAFRGCTSLVDINFPSTLRVIEESAFGECSSLVRVDFNEGLQTIEAGAFNGCGSIQHLKFPSTVTSIDSGAFGNCWAMKDVQLCEGLQKIGASAFYKCYSLLRINIPSSVTTIGGGAFVCCIFLRNVAIAPDSNLGQVEVEQSYLLHNHYEVGCSLDLAKGRFEDLHLHRICFHQMESATLLEEAKEHATEERLTQLDCLGMTPLHILACSGRHDVFVELYKFFVGELPEALLIGDMWGVTPLAYAMLSEAPQEIIHFLFEKHSNILSGSLPFDFQVMVEKLAKKEGTSAEFVRNIIQAQRTYFPTLEIEWERIVNENLEGSMHVKVFRVLVEASVSKRSICMRSEHRLELDNLINEINPHRRRRVDEQQIIDRIQDYAQQYREFLKDATTMLELALWKSAIDELENVRGSNEEGNHGGDKAENVNSESRRQCRFKCNTNDIFPIILSFI